MHSFVRLSDIVFEVSLGVAFSSRTALNLKGKGYLAHLAVSPHPAPRGRGLFPFRANACVALMLLGLLHKFRIRIFVVLLVHVWVFYKDGLRQCWFLVRLVEFLTFVIFAGGSDLIVENRCLHLGMRVVQCCCSR